MPVCHERKIAFVHVPKTAGTSVFNYFEFKKNVRSLHKCFCNYTVSLTLLTLHQMHDLINIQNYYKFAFVRNPWDRLVSKFNFDLQQNKASIKPFYHNGNFDDFIKKLSDNFNFILQLKPTQFISCHFLPQTNFVFSKKIKLDFLGRFENFDQDISKLAEKFNIKKEIKHENKTKHKPYDLYYNNKTRDIVEKLYKEDIKNFGYTFDKKVISFKSLV